MRNKENTLRYVLKTIFSETNIGYNRIYQQLLPSVQQRLDYDRDGQVIVQACAGKDLYTVIYALDEPRTDDHHEGVVIKLFGQDDFMPCVIIMNIMRVSMCGIGSELYH